MNGTRVRWDRGPRTLIEGLDYRGKIEVRTGKHGGPCIKQTVTKIIEPR